MSHSDLKDYTFVLQDADCDVSITAGVAVAVYDSEMQNFAGFIDV